MEVKVLPYSVVLDFETAGPNLEEMGSWAYSEHPTTEVLCLKVKLWNGKPNLLWSPWRREREAELLELARDPKIQWIAHNCGFEKAIWRNIMVPMWWFPDIPDVRWHDTMATAAMKAIPLGLDDFARVLRLPHQKDLEGRRLTLGLSKPGKNGYFDRSEKTLERVYTYCDDDIETQWAGLQRVGVIDGRERKVWLLDQTINQRGIRLDLEYVRACMAIVEEATEPLAAEFKDLTKGLKFTQGEKFKAWCWSRGVYIPNLQKDVVAKWLGKENEDDDDGQLSDDGILDRDGNIYLPADVHRALSIRALVGSSSIKKLPRMLACTGADERARGLLQYHGAGPGRWTARLLQPHNFPRGTIKLNGKAPPPQIVVEAILTRDAKHVQNTLGPPVEVVVSGLRHAIVAGRHRTFNVGDFAGIQARIVLALAGQHDKTALMASGADVYIDMANAIYKPPILWTKADKDTIPAQRQTGKNSVLGLGFGMGWSKFRFKYARGESREFCEGVVNTYRKEWAPKVPDLWRGLERAARETVWSGNKHEAYGVEYRMEDIWLVARAPSGSEIYYLYPEKTRREMPWSTDEDPDIRPSWSFKAKKQGKFLTVDAFGGLLTENVVMRLETDLLIEAMFKCEANNLPIVLTVHDEIMSEPENRFSDIKLLQQIMEDRPQWAIDMDVPVAAECWAGIRYKK